MTWIVRLAGADEPYDQGRWPDEYGVLPGTVEALQANTEFLTRPGAHETIRIHRTDRWVHDERVVSALHTLRAKGVTIIDPTGLLGGTEYGELRRDMHPAVRPNTGSLTSRRSLLHEPRKGLS